MDYLLGHSMQSKVVVSEELGCLPCIERGESGYCMQLLGEPVDHHKDGILSLRLRQGTDEIHGDGGPWP